MTFGLKYMIATACSRGETFLMPVKCTFTLYVNRCHGTSKKPMKMHAVVETVILANYNNIKVFFNASLGTKAYKSISVSNQSNSCI